MGDSVFSLKQWQTAFDLYESGTHHGLMSSGFITPFLFMIGMTSGYTNKLWAAN